MREKMPLSATVAAQCLKNLNHFVISFNLSIQKIILNLQHSRGG